MRLGSALLTAFVLLCACGGDGGELFVEVRTDLSPGAEFQTVRTVVTVAGDTRMVTVRAAAADDYITGARVAELASLAAGDATVDVTLLDGSDQTVATRRTRLALSGTQSLTVLITRSCRDVSCDAEQTCQSGGCVDERCSPDNPAACGTPECTVDGECTAEGVCAGATCADGVCLQVPDDALCGTGERCSLDDGCVVVTPDAGVDAGMDTGAPDTGAPDTGVPDTGSGFDAGGVLTEPFGPAMPIAELNTASNDDDPTLTVDQLEIIFATTRDGDANLYAASRARVGDPFGAAAPLATINTSSAETNPMLSRDGLTLYYGRGSRIWVSRRTAIGMPWQTSVRVEELRAGVISVGPAPSADHLSFIVCGRPSPVEPFDYYLSTRPTTADVWSTPALIPSLNSASEDVNGYFGVPGGQHFFFTTERPGGAGLRDLWYATRPNATAPFDPANVVPGTNTADNDENPWITDDLRTLYFASDRDGPNNLYMATR